MPNPSAWYCDERTSFEATRKGIGAVEYSSPAARGVRTVMYKSFWGEERFYLSAEDGLYGQNLKKLKIYPFGYIGEWSYKGLRFGYNVFTAKNCIFISLKTPENVPENLKFRLEFFEDNFPDTFYQSNIKYTDCSVRRSWRKSEFCNGVFRKSFCEDESEAAYILIGSDFMNKTALEFFEKNFLLHAEYVPFLLTTTHTMPMQISCIVIGLRCRNILQGLPALITGLICLKISYIR